MPQHYKSLLGRVFQRTSLAKLLSSLCSCMRSGLRATIVLIFTFAALFSSGVIADDSRSVTLESLVPTEDHQQATAVIMQLMQRYHYKPVRVSDELSEQIFDRYLESFDPQKSFLLASDIEEISEYRQKFDDACLLYTSPSPRD